MASIVVCPRCTSPLELPVEADLADQLQCPVCEVEFSLATVMPRELPHARVVEHAVESIEAPAGAETIVDFSIGDPATISDWQPPHATRASLEEFNVELADDVPHDDEDSTATAASSAAELQLGSSRLDQLLSDLLKGAAPAKSVPIEPVPSTEIESSYADAEPAGYAYDETVADPLANDFDAELEHEEPIGDLEDDDDRHGFETHIPRAAGALGDAAVELRAAPRRRKRSHPVRTAVGIVGGGALGLLLGAYALLWLRGRDGDIAGLAKWLPNELLPASVRSVADNEDADHSARAADTTPSHEPRKSLDELKDSTADAKVPVRFDPAVKAASTQEPVETNHKSPSVAEPVTPPAKPTIASQLHDVQLFTLDDLKEALVNAKVARQKLQSGDLARPEARTEMGQAYIELAKLAERFTLIDPATPRDETNRLRAEAHEELQAVVSDASQRSALELIAARWLQYEGRKNQGIVAAGRVKDVRPQAGWTECVLEIPLEPTAESVTAILDPGAQSR